MKLINIEKEIQRSFVKAPQQSKLRMGELITLVHLIRSCSEKIPYLNLRSGWSNHSHLHLHHNAMCSQACLTVQHIPGITHGSQCITVQQ